MKKNLIIFGSSYHANVVLAEIENYKNFEVIGYVDKSKKNQNLKFRGKLLKKISIDNLKNNLVSRGVFGIGENLIRQKIYMEMKKINHSFKWQKIISKNSIVSKSAFIQDGTFIAPGCIINHNTKIGSNCLINSGSIIEHDSELKDFSSVGPGVITGGNVLIKELSYVGISSVIKHNIIIEKNVVIGANSFVNKNCKKNSIFFGNPAKFQRSRKLDESQFGR